MVMNGDRILDCYTVSLKILGEHESLVPLPAISSKFDNSTHLRYLS
jgi:hypothetical protein